MAENEGCCCTQCYCSVPPSPLHTPLLAAACCSQLVSQRPAGIAPGIQCESLMSLWAFLIRVCICVCQMLSVERQRLAPQLHAQHAHRPARPPCPSFPLLFAVSIAASAVQWTPMVQWAIVVIDEPTLSVAYSWVHD